MKEIKIGILRENKIPIDRRVPILPEQCKEILEKYQNVSIYIQPSDIRCYSNKEYTDLGIPLKEDLSECDILLGIKEVPPHLLIKDKTYLFFSHTIKKQPQNQKLLQTVVQKRIKLIDYECLKDEGGQRIIAFGRFAGIVGAYNAILLYGRKMKLYDLKRAYECFDLEELKKELIKVKLPAVKMVITGTGRVGGGAVQVMEWLNIEKVAPADFLNKSYKTPVYTILSSKDYHKIKYGDAGNWNSEDFYTNPERYQPDFVKYLKVSDIFIAGAFWNPKAPKLFSNKDLIQENVVTKLIADITCDIGGSIPSTIKPTTIYDPAYDYNPISEGIEAPFSDFSNITVMAIDNLPGELPRDASKDFGRQLLNNVLPHLLTKDSDSLIENATIAKDGKLTEKFSYLEDYII